MRNPIFKQLILDNKDEEVISLNLSITTDVFIEIEKYYGGGTVVVNDRNIMVFLKFCYFYEEYNLFKKCKHFIVNHMNYELMVEVLKFISLIQAKEFGDIKNEIDKYYQLHCYIYFNNNIYLNFDVESLEYILSLQHIIIKSENYLLDKVVEYYDKKEENKSENLTLFQYINLQALDMNQLKPKIMKLLISSLPNEEESNKENDKINIIERYYLEPPENIDSNLRDILLQNYLRNYPILYIDCDILHYYDCKKEIMELLTHSNDTKMKIILILIIVELDYELDENMQIKIRSDLLLEYNKCENEDEKETIIKCLSYYINDCIYY